MHKLKCSYTDSIKDRVNDIETTTYPELVTNLQTIYSKKKVAVGVAVSFIGRNKGMGSRFVGNTIWGISASTKSVPEADCY